METQILLKFSNGASYFRSHLHSELIRNKSTSIYTLGSSTKYIKRLEHCLCSKCHTGVVKISATCDIMCMFIFFVVAQRPGSLWNILKPQCVVVAWKRYSRYDEHSTTSVTDCSNYTLYFNFEIFHSLLWTLVVAYNMVRVLRTGYFRSTKWCYKLVHCTTINPRVGKWLWVTAIILQMKSTVDSLPERNVITCRPTMTHQCKSV